MTTMTMTSDRNYSFGLDRIARRFSEWQRRARSRQELHGLSDATLRDMGITRCDAHREARKTFPWKMSPAAPVLLLQGLGGQHELHQSRTESL